MTIRDMLDSGIEFQGDLLIREINIETESYKREYPLNYIQNTKKLRDLLDKEIKYIYPNKEDEYVLWQYCIEVV